MDLEEAKKKLEEEKKNREEECSKEIKAVLEKHNCAFDIVTEVKHNGSARIALSTVALS